MSIDDFVATQEQLLQDGGLDEYLPTLWVETPSQVQIDVLMDPLEGTEAETSARHWAQDVAQQHDFCLGLRVDGSHLKVVARIGEVTSERVVAVKTAYQPPH